MIKKLIFVFIVVAGIATVAYQMDWLSYKGEKVYENTKDAIVKEGEKVIEKGKDAMD